MQALKTIADAAYHATRSEPVETVKAATSWVCGPDVLYACPDSAIVAFELEASTDSNEMGLRERVQDFTEAYAVTQSLALLYGGTLLMARGCTKPQEPTLSAAIGFWNVRSGNRVIEKVRDVAIQSPHNGAIANWAWCEQDAAFTVAIAFEDIHCSVQLLTFKRSDLRPSKPVISTVQVAKHSNGDAIITNLHLLRSENGTSSLRLFATISQRSGPGRIEARSIDSKQPTAAVTTLEAASVAKGRSTEYGTNHVIVVTSSEQTGPIQSAHASLPLFVTVRALRTTE